MVVGAALRAACVAPANLPSLLTLLLALDRRHTPPLLASCGWLRSWDARHTPDERARRAQSRILFKSGINHKLFGHLKQQQTVANSLYMHTTFDHCMCELLPHFDPFGPFF